jgi:hypothetical protein
VQACPSSGVRSKRWWPILRSCVHVKSIAWRLADAACTGRGRGSGPAAPWLLQMARNDYER